MLEIPTPPYRSGESEDNQTWALRGGNATQKQKPQLERNRDISRRSLSSPHCPRVDLKHCDSLRRRGPSDVCGGGTQAGGNLPLRRGQRRSAPAAPLHKSCAQQEPHVPHKSCWNKSCVWSSSQVKSRPLPQTLGGVRVHAASAAPEWRRIEQHASCTSLSRSRRAAVADRAAAGWRSELISHAWAVALFWR